MMNVLAQQIARRNATKLAETATQMDKLAQEKISKLTQHRDLNVLKTGYILHPMNNTDDFTPTNCTLTLDTDITKVNGGGLKLTMSGATTGRVVLDINRVMQNDKTISFFAYFDDVSLISSGKIYLADSSSYVWYLDQTIVGAKMTNGWNLIRIALSEMGENGPVDLSQAITLLRIEFTVTAATAIILSLTKIDGSNSPNISFTFDDVLGSCYTLAYPYMSEKGIVGSCGVISGIVGNSGYMTTDNLATLKRSGWDLSNHSKDGTSLTSLATEYDAINYLNECDDFLLDNELDTNGRLIVYYPNGEWNQQIIDAIDEAGYIGGRLAYTSYVNANNNNDMFKINVVFISDYATNKSYIDTAIERDDHVVFVIHNIVESDASGLDVLLSDFQQTVDYAVNSEATICKLSDKLINS